MGVHHGYGLGQLRLALVMVRHHHVQAQGVGKIHFLVSGDTAVHGDHQRGPLVPEALDGGLGEAVAVLNPPGDIAQALGPAAFQIVHQKHGGGDAVHVVVPEDGDGLPSRNGLLNPGHGLVHVPHEHGGQRQLPVPVQKLRRCFRGDDAPGRQHQGHQAGVARLPQRRHVLFPRGADVPLFVFHKSALLSRPACGQNVTCIL